MPKPLDNDDFVVKTNISKDSKEHSLAIEKDYQSPMEFVINEKMYDHLRKECYLDKQHRYIPAPHMPWFIATQTTDEIVVMLDSVIFGVITLETKYKKEQSAHVFTGNGVLRTMLMSKKDHEWIKNIVIPKLKSIVYSDEENKN